VHDSTRLIQFCNDSAILGVITDISSQKHAKNNCKKKKEHARQYLDIARVIIVVLNTRGKIELINKEGCEILAEPRNNCCMLTGSKPACRQLIVI